MKEKWWSSFASSETFFLIILYNRFCCFFTPFIHSCQHHHPSMNGPMRQTNNSSIPERAGTCLFLFLFVDGNILSQLIRSIEADVNWMGNNSIRTSRRRRRRPPRVNRRRPGPFICKDSFKLILCDLLRSSTMSCLDRPDLSYDDDGGILMDVQKSLINIFTRPMGMKFLFAIVISALWLPLLLCGPAFRAPCFPSYA